MTTHQKPDDKTQENRNQTRELDKLAYTVSDAIAVSSIGKTRLYALARDGKLKMTKIGKRTLVDAASLRELVRTGS